jgi:hypothetical protein
VLETPFIWEVFAHNVVLFLILILDIDKDLWTNIYLRVKPVMDKAMHLRDALHGIRGSESKRRNV